MTVDEAIERLTALRDVLGCGALTLGVCVAGRGGFPQVVEHHSPNGQILSGLLRRLLGADRTAIIMSRLMAFQRANGFRAGWPDLDIACPGGRVGVRRSEDVQG